MLANVTEYELKKQFNKRLLMVGLIQFILLAAGAGIYLTYATPQRTSYEAFSFSVFTILPMALPFLSALSTGITLAEERSLGLVPLFISRGVSPLQYILGKVIGSATAQICFTCITLAVFLLTTFIFFPKGPILTFGAHSEEYLAINDPFMHSLACILVYASAALAFSGIALLISVWVSNVFVVAVVPTVAYFAALYIFVLLDSNLNPYFHLALDQSPGPAFASAGTYWIAVAAISYLLAVLCFTMKKNWS